MSNRQERKQRKALRLHAVVPGIRPCRPPAECEHLPPCYTLLRTWLNNGDLTVCWSRDAFMFRGESVKQSRDRAMREALRTMTTETATHRAGFKDDPA